MSEKRDAYLYGHVDVRPEVASEVCVDPNYKEPIISYGFWSGLFQCLCFAGSVTAFVWAFK